MLSDYSYLSLLYKSNPAWRLLRVNSAPLILSFIHKCFIEDNQRIIGEAELISKLEDALYHIRRTEGEGEYSRSARDYLEEWAKNEKGWLRKFYPQGTDEPHFDLTPASEKALGWVDSLNEDSFVGTESRLRTLFELLKQMVLGAETNVEIRLQELKRQKANIEDQIEKIRNGELELLDDTSIKDRYLQVSKTARELLGDFRLVEDNFRKLDIQVREKIARWDGKKGGKGRLLDEIFGEHDAITDSDQGRNFRAFWDFLMSPESQDELNVLMEKVFDLDAVKELNPDRRLKRIHYDWLAAGEQTQRTVATLSQQLRRFLDNQVYRENIRILQLLDQVSDKALEIRDQMPKQEFTDICETGVEMQMPMSRLMYSVPEKMALDSEVEVAIEDEIVTDKLFNQVYVDKAILMNQVQRELQSKPQISLKQMVNKFPLQKGLAEIVAYLSLEGEHLQLQIEEEQEEELHWMTLGGKGRKLNMPRVIFHRK